MQNGYIERLNRFFREDVLDAYWIEDLEQLRILKEEWIEDQNNNHPHASLNGLSPKAYHRKAVNSGKLTKTASCNSEDVEMSLPQLTAG